MKTQPQPITRRRIRRPNLALIAALVAVVVLAFPRPALAGVFSINACQADRVGYATSAFEERATRGMSWRRACNPLGPGLRGLVTANVARPGWVARGAYSAFVLEAPPGTVFGELRWSGHAQRRDCRFALQLYAERPEASPVAIRNIRANRGCPRGQQAQASGWPLPRAYDVAGATRIVQRTICVGGRPGRRFCSARGRNFIRTFTAQVTVIDETPPAVVVVADGPLARGEWVAGTQSLTYDASDNTGVRSAHAVLGGIPRGGHARACVFALRVPCPNGPGRIEIDTRQAASEGTQPIHVVAEDAAGNQASSPPVTVRIDNTPPGTIAAGVEGGEGWRNRNGFDITWTNPPETDRAPITAARYRLCPAGGGRCETDTRQGMGIGRIEGLLVPGAGEWDVRIWREDAAGNHEPANASLPVRLRFDPEPPQVAFQPLSATDPTRITARAIDQVSGVAAGRIEIGREGIWQELPTKLQGEHLSARIDDAALPPGDYTLRATARDHAENQATTDRLVDGRLMQVRLPLRIQTQLRAGVAERRKVRRIMRRAGKRRPITRTVTVLRPQAWLGFGRPVRLAGRLTDTGGEAIPSAPLHLYATPRFGDEQLMATLTTDDAGRYSHRLRPTASQALRLAYPGTALILPAEGQIQLRVAATSTLKVNRRRVLNGGQAVFAGRVLGRPVPSVGKLVEVQVLLTGGWQTFRTTRTDSEGRWRVPYRFSRTCGIQRFAFRARLPTEATWPLETGASRPSRVTVKGQPCP